MIYVKGAHAPAGQRRPGYSGLLFQVIILNRLQICADISFSSVNVQKQIPTRLPEL